MDQVMTIAEMEARFDSEWILIGDPQTDESLALLSGEVLWHSKDRDEVHRKVLELQPKRFAVVYTGRIPEDAAVVL